MTQDAIRFTAAGIAIAAVALISLGNETPRTVAKIDPSVPSAAEVFHANDGRAEGNTTDLTY
jgi:hypothetical protein